MQITRRTDGAGWLVSATLYDLPEHLRTTLSVNASGAAEGVIDLGNAELVIDARGHDESSQEMAAIELTASEMRDLAGVLREIADTVDHDVIAAGRQIERGI